MANSINIELLKKEYRSGITGTSETRTEALKARSYKDGKPYTPMQLAIFAKRKQPVIVYNRVRKKVNGLLGFEITRRTDPIAYGRTEQDMAAASTATKILRFIEEDQNIDGHVTTSFDNMIVEGTGGIEVTIVKKKPDFAVNVRALPWEMLYYDPRSRKPDFSDASFKGISEWMSLDEALTRYGKEKQNLLEFSEGGDDLEEDESTEDRPAKLWFDETGKRVRVVQHWRIQGGQWHYYTFTGQGIIEEGVSPYKDDEGQTVCSLNLMSTYVDKDNIRHGIVRDLFGPQDEINHRRSKLLHKLSERQFFYSSGSLADPAKTRRELKKPDGVIEVSHGEYGKQFGIIKDDKGLAGQAELLAEAKAEIDTQGINPALIGRESGAASGRAILATQQGAIAEEAIVFDRLRAFKLTIYKAAWNMAKQFYRAERVIRITDDRRAPEFIGLNKIVAYTPEGKPIVNNPIARMNVDLIIDEVQDSATLQAEEFEKITRLMESVPNFAAEVDMIDVLKASSLTNKHEWIEKIEKKREQAAKQPPNPMQEQAVQLELAEKQAGIKDKVSGAELKDAKTIKTMAEIGETKAKENKLDVESRVVPFQAAHAAAHAQQGVPHR
ncbi:MAG: hypothetical protein COB36_11585 [Alphaproteobacteria bacterium]|nr:MAG: hypothetical protein COB36_11585 [Alphaproteobacteria bacterium]